VELTIAERKTNWLLQEEVEKRRNGEKKLAIQFSKNWIASFQTGYCKKNKE